MTVVVDVRVTVGDSSESTSRCYIEAVRIYSHYSHRIYCLTVFVNFPEAVGRPSLDFGIERVTRTVGANAVAVTFQLVTR